MGGDLESAAPPTFRESLRATALEYAEQAWSEHLRLVLFGLRYAFRVHACVTIAASCICVWLCSPLRLGLSWDANFTVIVFGVIFPLTYSISENFRRRERCADVIARMKASSVALLWLHRDLDRGVRAHGDALHRVEQLLPQPSPRRDTFMPALPAGSTTYNAFVVLNEFLCSTRLFLIAEDADVERINTCHARAVRALSTMNVMNELLGEAAGYTKGCEGGVSRAAQYTRFLLENLEQLRILRSYSGSPHGMRFFCALMTHVSPLLLAPYFRHFCSEKDLACAPGYYSAALFGIVLTTLYSVSVDIEDLCDGKGMDDLIFNADVELREAAQLVPFRMGPSINDRSPAPRAPALPPPGPMPRIWVSYDDYLGRECSGAMVEAPSERVVAHRDPSLRVPRLSGFVEAEPPPPPSAAAAAAASRLRLMREQEDAMVALAEKRARAAASREASREWDQEAATFDEGADERDDHDLSEHPARRSSKLLQEARASVNGTAGGSGRVSNGPAGSPPPPPRFFSHSVYAPERERSVEPALPRSSLDRDALSTGFVF